MKKQSEIYASVVSHRNQSALELSGFLIDSGASAHMVHDKSLFSSLKFATRGRIKVADGSLIPILGCGTITVWIKTDTQPISLTLRNVAYAPKLHVNLISVHELNKSGYTLLFEKSLCKIKIDKRFVELGKFHNNNFMMCEDTPSNCFPCIHEWHRRLAHRNYRDIKPLQNFGLKITKCCCIDPMLVCEENRLKRLTKQKTLSATL